MSRGGLSARVVFALATRLALQRLPDGCPRQGMVSFSFDDVPRSAWTEGGAVLARHGVRGTYYLTGGLCGTIFEGRAQYEAADIPAIAAAGHEIGSHQFTHVSTLTLGPAGFRREIAANDGFLRSALGPAFRARSYAYPYGEVSLSSKWLASRRFDVARGVEIGVNRPGDDAGQLRVLAIDNIFADRTDWDRIFRQVAQDGAWAIVLAHGVDDTGHPFSCPPARLERAVQGALAAGLDLLPVCDAAARWGMRPR